MKAVILAGGEGARLRPLSCGTPKPMTMLIDRPVMAHTIDFLKRHGIREIAVTLCYKPRLFREFFGDGSQYGVRLSYFEEHTPKGTAGAVAACREFLDDDILVISGDAVCDFDLTPVFAFHQERRADVTVVLSRQQDPRSFGLVLTDRDGRVQRFLEKPAWDSVFTDAANTGIYLLSPGVLSEVSPDRPCDFARDLFPRLMAEGKDIYALAAEGYWCDIGNPAAYLRCVQDALAGRIRLDLPARTGGISTASPLPQDAVISPPVFIGENVTIGSGAHIGPYTVLGDGSRVGTDARVTGSAVLGAAIHTGARIRGSILCRGAEIGAYAILREGCVIGEQAVIGERAELHEGVLVWPEKRCEDDAELRFSITSHATRTTPVFDESAALSGRPDTSLSPEFCCALGTAAAMACSAQARIGISWTGNLVCGMLASALECGVRAAGVRVVRCGAGFSAAAAYAARYAALDLCFYVDCEDEQVTIRLYDADGLPPQHSTLRRIENILHQGDLQRAPAEKTGQILKLSGLMDAYCREAAAYGAATGRIYAVRKNVVSPALCNTLWLMGARIAPSDNSRPVFSVSADGCSLRIRTESGRVLDEEQSVSCAAYAVLTSGQNLALPFSAPAAYEDLAAKFGRRALRLGRDGDEARNLWAKQLVFRDGIHRAAQLAAYTAGQGMTLDQLADAVPSISIRTREIPLFSDRAQLMRTLSDRYGESHPEYGKGLRIQLAQGWVTISPAARIRAIRVSADSSSMETAEELCSGIVEQIEHLDRDIKRRKIR